MRPEDRNRNLATEFSRAALTVERLSVAADQFGGFGNTVGFLAFHARSVPRKLRGVNKNEASRKRSPAALPLLRFLCRLSYSDDSAATMLSITARIHCRWLTGFRSQIVSGISKLIR